MISIFEAQETIEEQTLALSAETIDLSESVGRVLAETVSADLDLPPFDRSQMDGFAVRAEDVKTASEKNPVRLKIIGESLAGKGFDGEIETGETVRIMTGARVPNGANSVQKKELTGEFSGENFVEIFEAVKLQQNIVKRGDEVAKGDLIFQIGETVNTQMIAALASFGYAKIDVYKKPRVTILATGSEIVDASEKPQKDQIRNSNSPMLRVFAEKAGAETIVKPIVKDDKENLKSEIKNCLETCDILLITGGVSVGDYDFTKPALKAIGAEIFFEKVNLKPGKPTVFARLNEQLIFGLPGNPVSVAVTFFLFVLPAILKMQRAENCHLERGFAVAEKKLKAAKERDSVLPVSVRTNKKGELLIESLRFAGSSNFVAFSKANALAFVPKGKNYESGDAVEIAFLPA